MKKVINVVAAFAVLFSVAACVEPSEATKPTVTKATADVQTNASGRTIEQENVKRRLEEDNKIGSIKHLYVISAYSGQVLMYSTVKGKVTSSSKRLTNPKRFARVRSGGYGSDKLTNRLGDDGTYGSSVPYVFWWDTKGIYHQHYVSGGSLLHISEEAMSFGSVTVNVEVQ